MTEKKNFTTEITTRIRHPLHNY